MPAPPMPTKWIWRIRRISGTWYTSGGLFASAIGGLQTVIHDSLRCIGTGQRARGLPPFQNFFPVTGQPFQGFGQFPGGKPWPRHQNGGTRLDPVLAVSGLVVVPRGGGR